MPSTSPKSPGQSPKPQQTARARLRVKAATSLLRDFTKTQLNSMGEAIAAGLEAGKGPREIARMLTDVQGLDPQRAARLEKVPRYLEASDLSNDALEKALERERQKLLRDRREAMAALRPATRDKARRGRLRRWAGVRNGSTGSPRRTGDSATSARANRGGRRDTRG